MTKVILIAKANRVYRNRTFNTLEEARAYERNLLKWYDKNVRRRIDDDGVIYTEKMKIAVATVENEEVTYKRVNWY